MHLAARLQRRCEVFARTSMQLSPGSNAGFVRKHRMTPTAPDRRKVAMTLSEYEERFRPPAPSLHQTFAAARGRNQERRPRRIWAIAAALGVLTITCRVASHHAVHGWKISHGETPAVQEQTSPTSLRTLSD
jgi:hypothetical protein